MTYRIIQWATGTCGKSAVEAITNNPDLELVGARVYDPKKVGRDVGDICGLPPIGVKATDNEEALLALPADCILWMGAATMFAPGASIDEGIADLCRMLEAGKNVISIVHTPFVHPKTLPSNMREPIEAACRKGQTTFHASGIDPGFASEVLSLTASGICQKIDKLKVQEIMNYSSYNNPQIIFDVMGFGKPPNSATLNGFAQAMMSVFGSSLHLIAQGLGVEIEEIRPFIEAETAPRDFTIAAGLIKTGTVSAMRFGFDAFIGGEPRLSVEHVTRLDKSQAPHWDQGEGYRLTISGVPSMEISFKMGTEGRDELTDTVIAAAMHAVNAIPAVCDARPGILTFLDLPMITGRHTLRTRTH